MLSISFVFENVLKSTSKISKLNTLKSDSKKQTNWKYKDNEWNSPDICVNSNENSIDFTKHIMYSPFL